jgi:5-methyltetrahydropteroyltriglutamate--homocysteine methyltransferase
MSRLSSLPPIPTTVVGSYPQPDWLADREMLRGRLPPRIRAREIWRVPPAYLEQAQDDATIVAIHELERAGIDILTDGEIRRESYSNRFATALDGIDLDNPGHALGRSGKPDIVPRVVGPIRRREPVELRDLQFLRANTERPVKITVPGPFTMTQQAVDDYYGDEREVALAFAAAVNAELRDLEAAGADLLQIDEPYMQARVEQASRYAVEAINRALEDIKVPVVLHTCFGYGALVRNKAATAYPFLEALRETAVDQVSIEAAEPELDLSVLERMGDKTMVVGVLNLGSEQVESVDAVAGRIRAALRHLPAERLVVAPDCGMKYLPRRVAFAKLRAMVEAAGLVRAELDGRAS